MSRHYAACRTRQLDHSSLLLDVCFVIGLANGGACFVFLQISIQITIVRSQYKRLLTVDAQVLRGVRMPRAGEYTDPWQNLLIVAVHQPQSPFGIDLHEGLNILRVDSAVIPSGLPRL